MEARCACGAVGTIVAGPAPTGRVRPQPLLLHWRGGRIGADRLAIEAARSGAVSCPACQHRAAVFAVERGRER